MLARIGKNRLDIGCDPRVILVRLSDHISSVQLLFRTTTW